MRTDSMCKCSGEGDESPQFAVRSYSGFDPAPSVILPGDQFDTVSKDIFYVTSVYARNTGIVSNRDSCGL